MTVIQTFFLRVSARCNLDCSYCYVFKHRDQSWMKYPAVISKENVILFSKRLKEYVLDNDLKTIYVIFHGGEPLFIGKSLLFEYMRIIKEELNGISVIEFSIQTNGTLINQSFIDRCALNEVKISISIDGPKKIHDECRRFSTGKGSFDHVLQGIKHAQTYPHIFQGVIGVINPFSEPNDLLAFYHTHSLHHIDLLLPDANYITPPKGRSLSKNLYRDWLIETFDIWFDKYQELSFKTYEFILKSLLGGEDSSDAFGFGKLNYITIETDGSFHTSDILKVAYENASNMGATMNDISINEAVNHKKVHEYNELLRPENLPPICKTCQVMKICGGGSLPHRYSYENGFYNPTIYCQEMKDLILHAQDRLENEIQKELNSTSQQKLE